MDIKRFIRPIASLILRPLSRLLAIFPHRLSFALTVLVHAAVPGAAYLLAMGMARISTRRIIEQPTIRFSSALTDHFPESAGHVLNWIGARGEAVDVIERSGL